MNFSKSILRIFEVRPKPEHAEKLKQKLSDTSVDVVNGQPGNLGYFFGRLISSTESDLVFISVWKDMDAIKARFGADWEESFLPEGYEAMIESHGIKHVEFDGFILLTEANR